MTAQAGMTGHAPSVRVEPYNPEQRKYAEVWKHNKYREVSPGEMWAQMFLEQARPPRDADAIDFGCGTGRGALMLALFGSLRVNMLDFAPNCLDPEVAQACETQPNRIEFNVHDLTRPPPFNAAYGYCCDVMEHIPPEDVRKVLLNVLSSAQHVFFGISTVPDNLGVLIGETLHLTVQPMAWWVEQLQALGAVVHWTREMDGACAIYCSAWREAGEIVKIGKINVGDEQVRENVRINLQGDWKQVIPYEAQDREVVLLAGGPSMAEGLEQIKALREQGCAVVTVNGAYNWAIQNGLADAIGAQIVLDAREFNGRFVDPILPKCRYLMASQVHPNTLAKLPKERTELWHTGDIGDENEKTAREKNSGYFFPAPGGSTVVLRAIPLLRMLGFKRLHIFGFDSCVRQDGTHHAYSQLENDREPVIPVTCGGRTFMCTTWMTSQASEFRDVVKLLGDEIELAVYGDGLIAHIIATGASFSKD